MPLFVLKNRDKIFSILIDEILCFQADEDFCNMTNIGGQVIHIKFSISYIDNALKEQLGAESLRFKKIGRDYIIQTSFLFSVDTLNKTFELKSPILIKPIKKESSKAALKDLKKEFEEICHFRDSKDKIYLQDNQTRKIYTLSFGENTFGRESNPPQCRHIIDNGDSRISRKQFCISIHKHKTENKFEYSLIDLGSKNGTFISNRILGANEATLLHVGDKIKVGNTEFACVIVDNDYTELQ